MANRKPIVNSHEFAEPNARNYQWEHEDQRSITFRGARLLGSQNTRVANALRNLNIIEVFKQCNRVFTGCSK